jgi:hypothetical protein
MILAILLIIFIIVLISALLYILGCLVSKRMISSRKKYQDHIDSMVEELFPPSIQDSSAIDTTVLDTTVLDTTVLDTTVQEAAVIESDLQRQEAKRKMVADIRKYFNQHKIDATLAKVQGSNDFVKINPSAGSYSEQIIPTPPSIQMLLE